MRVSKTSDVLVLLALTSVLAPLTHLARVRTTANQVLLHQSASRKAVLSESVSVHAAGRGNPSINLTDGRDVLTSYEGPGELTAALEQNFAQPLSLASADFDEDGVPDLISGYAGPRSGIVTMLRGNVDALFPNAPEPQRRRAEGEFTESPFLSPGRAFWLPEFPDFIGTGDFDADGHRDVVAAARGSNVLYKLSGDGRGGFAPPVAINLPGAVTTLTTGEINRSDGLEDVIVGITGADGAKVFVFESPEGALRAAPETFAIPREAVSLALGQLTGDYWMDLAVAAGNDLLIITGRDRKLSLDQPSKAAVPQAKITRRSFSSALKSVTTGDFTGDFKTDLALLFEDGTVEVLSPAKQRTQNVKNWRIDRTASSSWPNAKELVRAKVSTLPHDDLVIVDSAGRQLQILADARQVDSRSRGLIATASLEAASVPVAMLPMRLNSDALSDLVILEAGHIAPVSSFTIASATVTVDSTTDVNDGDTSSIANLMSSKGVDGVISLREAITAANNTPGADTINFGIGSGVRTISIGFAFPAISDPVTIDGTTQPGFAGEPIIELDGSGSGTGADGLDLVAGAGSSTVRGLIINRFFGPGVRITTDGIHVEGCFIGTNAAGTSANGNLSDGVLIDNVPNTTIGGTVAAARNVISGNSLNGVAMQGIDGFGNAVRGNFIGTDKNGTAALGNSGSGVCISLSISNNTVGGTTAAERNVISGNNNDGVDFLTGAASNQVMGNFIGTNVSGTFALGNGLDGVFINNAPSNKIGGTSPGAGNVISGNTLFNGVDVLGAGSTGTLVQGNFIGTDVSGSIDLGNGNQGVLIDTSAGNTIGGTSAQAGNIIAFNMARGVVVNNGSASILSNSIFSNVNIGIDLGGDGVTPNDGNDGDTGSNNLQNFPVLTFANSFGGSTTIFFTLNSVAGITYRVEFFSSSACDGSGNGEGQTFIGFTNVITDGSGNATINVTLPVSVTPGSVVTATATDPGNNTSEFSACRVVQMLSTTTFVVDFTGDLPDSNLGDMVCEDGTGHCTLRAAIEQANSNTGTQTINFNIPGGGVKTISPLTPLPATTGPVIIDGTTQPGFAGSPIIELNGMNAGSTSGLTIDGGSSIVQGLVINRFGQHGIAIQFLDGNQVKGCFIGTDAAGAVDQGNSGNGILIQSGFNTIGGAAIGDRNVISGNNVLGVSIAGALVTGNAVGGNFIGTNAAGTGAIPNGSSGVGLLNSSNNTIGGTNPGEGNTIAFNSSRGVEISSGTNNSILRNSIFNNSTLGIDLGSVGVTPNDAGDGDNLQNFPVLTTANSFGGNTTIAGTLNSTANTSFRIEFFANSACDPSGNGEGETFEGFTDVMTDGGGNATINAMLAVSLSAGLSVTATATNNSTKDTSEFSSCVTVTASSPCMITCPPNAVTVSNDPGQCGAVVNYPAPSASGSCGAVNCNPPSGSLFGKGTTLVTCTTAAGPSCSFDVKVNDTQAPTITCPADVTATAAQGVGSAIVNYSAPSAADNCPGAGSVCSPASGTSFPVGVTQVDCTATDSSGNTKNCSFNVTVNESPAISIDNVNVVEGNSGTANAVFTVTLSPASALNVTVNFATADGTAKAGSDYVAAAGTLSFAPGDTSKTITVQINGDTLSEPEETFFVNLSGAANAPIIVPQGTGTIVNDDGTAGLSINDVTLKEGDSGAVNAVFTVMLSPASGLPVTVTFATADGTAKAGSDYLPNSGTLSFAPGQVSQPIIIQVIGDTVSEPDETLSITLSGATNANITDGQGTGTIINDDGAPGLSISDASVIEGNSGAVNAVFTVTLSPASGQTVTVNFATADDTATVANNDYVTKSGTLTFNPGERNKTIDVQVIGDNSQEPDETFLVRLSSPVNAEILDGIGAGTIINDETPLAADLSVTTSVANVINSGEQLAYTITIGNAGPRVATSIRLLDVVPTGCTLSSVRVRAGVVTAPSPGAAGRIIWTLDSLAPAGEATLDLVINVLALAGDTLVNTASVQSLSPDPDATNNTSVALTTVQGGGSVELVWDQPDSTPLNPTPAPTNVRVEGSGPAVSRVTKTSVAPAANKCDLVEFKVYISPTRPVQVTPSNLWKSGLPPEPRKVSLPALPAGTFYIVVAVWRCDGTDVDSPPSNEASAPPVPAVTKMVVKSQIKITGINFKSGLVISIDGVRFEERAVIKRGGTLVIQRGKLTDGRSIQDVLNSGKTVLMVLRNPDGGMATILLPTLPSSP